ncbi:unnamed protein product [Symbiodinium sp. CCMP2456]|nr:unnamed protein product [Symbiodinium sp. CCMP2456]
MSFPHSDRAGYFHDAVAAALSAEADGSLRVPTLWALLEAPVDVFARQGSCPEGQSYEELPLEWSSCGQVETEIETASRLQHEVSQTFCRPLSFERSGSFRIHRFHLSCEGAERFNDALARYALKREAGLALSKDAVPDGIQVSNVGGFHSKQDLFRLAQGHARADKEDALLLHLKHLIAECVAAAAAADAQEFQDREEVAPHLPSGQEEVLQLDSNPDGWVNVSRKGHLNYLHNHADASVATVYYARVQPDSGGSLLLRLSPGYGPGMMEPDEERHVPWMWSSDGQPISRSPVQYAELRPSPGTLVIFPGWLSHSVSPTTCAEARISFASNWDLPTEPG